MNQVHSFTAKLWIKFTALMLSCESSSQLYFAHQIHSPVEMIELHNVYSCVSGSQLCKGIINNVVNQVHNCYDWVDKI